MRYKYLYVLRQPSVFGDPLTTEYFGVRDENYAGEPTLYVTLPSPNDAWWLNSTHNLIVSADGATKHFMVETDGTLSKYDSGPTLVWRIDPTGTMVAGIVPPGRIFRLDLPTASIAMTLDVVSKTAFKWTATENETIDVVPGAVDGQEITLIVKDDGAGRTLIFSSAFSLVSSNTVVLTAGKKHTFKFVFDSAKFLELSRAVLG